MDKIVSKYKYQCKKVGADFKISKNISEIINSSVQKSEN